MKSSMDNRLAVTQFQTILQKLYQPQQHQHQLYDSNNSDDTVDSTIEHCLNDFRRLIAQYGAIPDETEEQRTRFNILLSSPSPSPSPVSPSSNTTNDNTKQPNIGHSDNSAIRVTEQQFYKHLHSCSSPFDITPLRGLVYKAFLKIPRLNSTLYLKLYHTPSDSDTNFLMEGSRTFSEKNERNKLFQARISSVQISRILNAFALRRSPKEGRVKYSQGVTSIAAILLYCMHELEAFYCYDRIFTDLIPIHTMNDEREGRDRRDYVFQWVRSYAREWTRIDVTEQSARIGLVPHYNSFLLQGQDFVQCLRLFDFYMAFGFYMFPLVLIALIEEHRSEIEKCGGAGREPLVGIALQNMKLVDVTRNVRRAVEFYWRLSEEEQSKLERIYLKRSGDDGDDCADDFCIREFNESYSS